MFAFCKLVFPLTAGNQQFGNCEEAKLVYL